MTESIKNRQRIYDVTAVEAYLKVNFSKVATFIVFFTLFWDSKMILVAHFFHWNTVEKNIFEVTHL